MEPTLLDSIAAPPATDIELTTVVAFAAGVLLWVRGAKLTESATLILGLAGGGLVGARLASVGGLEGVEKKGASAMSQSQSNQPIALGLLWLSDRVLCHDTGPRLVRRFTISD